MTPERRAFFLRAVPPLLVGAVIALLPVPEGLKPQAWHYFALFAAVIVGVATEPRTEFWILGFVVLLPWLLRENCRRLYDLWDLPPTPGTENR